MPAMPMARRLGQATGDIKHLKYQDSFSRHNVSSEVTDVIGDLLIYRRRLDNFTGQVIEA